MEEHIYQPYDVRMSEEGEIVAIIEPDSYITEVLENENIYWEIELDVDYDEDEWEAFLLISFHKDNSQIFMAFPYGEAWDALVENGTITIALIDQQSLEKGDVSKAISVSIQLNEFDKGFIEGAEKMWESISEIR